MTNENQQRKVYHASIQDMIPLMQEQLAEGKQVRFSPRGTSMLPMLREGVDSVVLSPVPQKLKKYDLPLYRRDDGTYVLHRVVKVGQTYTCMGDNQFRPEPGLRHDQMIALVTGFQRNGREHTVTEPGYRLYCCAWHHTRTLRHFCHRAIRYLRRHLK